MGKTDNPSMSLSDLRPVNVKILPPKRIGGLSFAKQLMGTAQMSPVVRSVLLSASSHLDSASRAKLLPMLKDLEGTADSSKEIDRCRRVARWAVQNVIGEALTREIPTMRTLSRVSLKSIDSDADAQGTRKMILDLSDHDTTKQVTVSAFSALREASTGDISKTSTAAIGAAVILCRDQSPDDWQNRLVDMVASMVERALTE